MNIQPVTKRNLLKPSSYTCTESNLQSVQRMRRFAAIATLCLGLLSAEQAFGQTIERTAQDAPGHAGQASCLILERMGAVGQITSRVLSFGIHGKQFHYIEGRLPEGFSFHDKLTDHDVGNLQARGSDVVILNSDYVPEELEEARSECRAETRKVPIQATTAQIEIASTPPGSDIELDGKFIGSTPSLVKVSLGEHTLQLTKYGYEMWERKITTMSGSVRISPDLEPSTTNPGTTDPQKQGVSMAIDCSRTNCVPLR